jgi:hypothetical protein
MDVLSTEALKTNAALTVYKLLQNHKQAAKLYPLLDPKTSTRFNEHRVKLGYASEAQRPHLAGGLGRTDFGAVGEQLCSEVRRKIRHQPRRRERHVAGRHRARAAVSETPPTVRCHSTKAGTQHEKVRRRPHVESMGPDAAEAHITRMCYI